ncbi:MAG: 2-(1,2-epoxy-1,2-dihydrophenyl)acetyl-CoA isomerase [Burkholderiales bacterium]|nr:MAG: 2-(1,2-epoxy-1,2-dihydrophenyl)acetyl-CoA isomerase [Burkholderiales bacterium]
MTEQTILYEERAAGNAKIALITLNRPAALNSFIPAMHEALRAALAKASADGDIRACVITGAGRGFCAGADLGSFDFTPGRGLKERGNPGPVIEAQFNPTARAVMNLRMPTICAVNGVAAGAGASLVMSCDMAIAAPGASFVQAFSKIGLIPDAGGSWLLPQRLGLARALGLAFTGDKLSAAQAKEFGMIWDVQDDALGAALALAEKLAQMPTQALVETRRLLRTAQNRSFDQQLDIERDAQTAMGMTDDYIEGVNAFLQKRVPQFKGQ